jgi:hypothetical protein
MQYVEKFLARQRETLEVAIVADAQVPRIERATTVVNNQLSGAGKVEIDLIDFLFKPSIY